MLHRLAWDSAHFGFPVARIQNPTLSSAELEETLGRARRQGYKLVYWAAENDHPVSPTLLSQYCGSVVVKKIVFFGKLRQLPNKELADLATDLEIREYPVSEASSELVALAIEAGAHSRFFVDPRIPEGAASGLYTIWIQRSARRELADMLFVATVGGRLAGMVSCTSRSGRGAIGLIAVDSAFRGKGIGTALLSAAHQWMIATGAVWVEVVTQRQNTAACALYHRCGYAIASVQDFYHFWPLENLQP